MKLTIDDKYDLCDSFISGLMTYKQLALKYNTTDSNIRRYVKNYDKMKIGLPRECIG